MEWSTGSMGLSSWLHSRSTHIARPWVAAVMICCCSAVVRFIPCCAGPAGLLSMLPNLSRPATAFLSLPKDKPSAKGLPVRPGADCASLGPGSVLIEPCLTCAFGCLATWQSAASICWAVRLLVSAGRRQEKLRRSHAGGELGGGAADGSPGVGLVCWILF